MHRRLVVSTLLLGLFAMPARAQPDGLTGIDWVLAGASGTRAPYLRFEAGRVGGLGGCNRFKGSYKLSGSKLSFSPLAATQMACLDGFEAERAFFDMLGKVRGMSLKDGRLKLLDASGAVLASFTRRAAP
jgi:heat shock protein HslJ